jgi:hypothetical protein
LGQIIFRNFALITDQIETLLAFNTRSSIFVILAADYFIIASSVKIDQMFWAGVSLGIILNRGAEDAGEETELK